MPWEQKGISIQPRRFRKGFTTYVMLKLGFNDVGSFQVNRGGEEEKEYLEKNVYGL